MRVFAIRGGLGSQMFKYAFFLSQKKSNPKSLCFLDTLAYKNKGNNRFYELDNIFNIKDDLIDDHFTKFVIKIISVYRYDHSGFVLNKLLKLDKKITFYSHRSYIKKHKFKLILYGVGFSRVYKLIDRISSSFKNIFSFKNRILNNFHSPNDLYDLDFFGQDYNFYFDDFNHNSDLYFSNLKTELIDIFSFPQITDQKNLNVKSLIDSENSISVHIRRTDHTYDNQSLIDNGYFYNAVSYIKKNVSKPYFFIFSDDISWCTKNIDILNLKESDNVVYVDWNKDKNSFIDMHLMTYCKHNILSISSFGWWGHYLNKHANKISIAPKNYWLDVGIHI
jgi:hypothetical protein